MVRSEKQFGLVKRKEANDKISLSWLKFFEESFLFQPKNETAWIVC